jgi:hypothetical protein
VSALQKKASRNYKIYVECNGETRNTYFLLVGKYHRALEDQDINRKIILSLHW